MYNFTTNVYIYTIVIDLVPYRYNNINYSIYDKWTRFLQYYVVYNFFWKYNVLIQILISKFSVIKMFILRIIVLKNGFKKIYSGFSILDLVFIILGP